MKTTILKDLSVRKTLKMALYALPFYLVMTTAAFGQKTVTGIITDASTAAPLPGATVLVKGTTNGVTTDFDGNYQITVDSESDILIFSYIGYQAQELSVEGKSEINVNLAVGTNSLDEVVIVGYGSQSKRNITGAMSSVDVEKVNQSLPNVNIAQSLTGATGVQFIGDGRPGQSGALLIRGQSSLSGSNDPLIVLDGIIFNGELNDINPQDIKTIDILKDASSTAIYGSRAANGVILITSKSGKTAKPKVSVNLFSGLSDPTNTIQLLSPDRYIERRLEWRRQSGLEADPNQLSTYFSPTEAENIANGVSVDPFDLALQQGSIHSVDASVSGRTEGTNYFASTSFSDNKGLVINDNEKRITTRVNLVFDLAKWLDVGVNAMYSRRDLSGLGASLFDAYRSSPYGTFYNEDGSPTQYSVPSERAASSPLWNDYFTKNDEIKNNLFSNIFAELSTPLFGGELSYRMNYSPNIRWEHEYNYRRQDPNSDSNTTYANKYNRNDFDWLQENIVTYKKALGEAHKFDITLLYSRNHQEYEETYAESGQLSLDGLGYDNLGLGTNIQASSYAQKIDGVSYMGRVNYQLLDRYLFTLTARRDGSSVFAKNNKYATFPSAAFGWIISDEPFFNEDSSINLLKLRLSYGSVGNQAIDPYQSLSLSSTTGYVFGNGGSTSIGVVPSTLGNNDLKWETTTSTNIGLDFGLLSGRINGSLEWYNSKTEDLLVRRSIPVTGGFSSILTNIGEVNNTGIELQLNSVNVRNDNFEWTTSFNFGYNKNEIVHLFGTDLDGDGKEDDSIANGWFIGQPINSFFDYQFDGIYQEGDTDIPEGFSPGFVRVKDINGDGEITSDDRTVVGSGDVPEYTMGLRNNFTYKNFTLSVFVNSLLGWEAPFNLINPLVPGRSINQYDGGWWTPENQSNSRPSLLYSNPLGIDWYSSRNFVRIRDVSLTYQFDQEVLDKLKLSSLRLSLSAKNLYTFTDWLGSDPESGDNYTSIQGSSNLYPLPRTFSLGLNIGF
ncbi:MULTISPECIES: SusC/RagA family TonB-linked outer membrane protein [Flavobacteriaceae]|uniref:SusC/RagA family TonB-linked outer membrane protein n=1 Tax=Flavobacteriaceae TaxID=49546 RepID=UPI001491B4AF|nr:MULTISPECIES: TonB-dependent receptor [Allomuricauda]MDC6366254.1 TonB-dependent receptor [Muricauda sp. AC10]